MDFSANFAALFSALVSGIFMAIQGTFNTALSKVIGLLEATFVVHLTGTLVILIILGVFKFGRGNLMALPQAPWYAYLGGLLGVAIIYLVAASIPRIGVANATTAIIIGQVLTAILIDHFGGFGMEKMAFGWRDFAGLILLAAGAKLLLK